MKRSNDEQFVNSKRKRESILYNEFLSVYPIKTFDKKFPFYSKPKKVGHFSIDSKRSFSIDQSQLKYLTTPTIKTNVNYDLRVGYKDFVKKPENEKLDNLLKWIKESNYNKNVDFICWRGLLTKILCIPFENNEPFRMAVQRFNGILHICEFKTEEGIAIKLKETDKQKEMCYWGLRFENYVTHKFPQINETDDSVNANEEYSIVVETKLENLSIVMGAEVDCCYAENNDSFIELKTNKVIQNERQMFNFKRFKLIKWWAQSFLIGIEEIICGFRNDDGFVTHLETFYTNNIPKLVQAINNTWNAAICFNFLLQVLKYIKYVAIKEWNKAIYVFNWSPRSDISFTIEDVNSNFAFLPTWYTENVS